MRCEAEDGQVEGVGVAVGYGADPGSEGGVLARPLKGSR